jgi:hypothetical protein
MLTSMTAEVLARFQFAFTVSFHIIFPAFSIGLASFLAVLNAQWLRTGADTYRDLFNYWKKSLRSLSEWVSCPESSCPTNSARIGAFLQIAPASFWAL